MVFTVAPHFVRAGFYESKFPRVMQNDTTVTLFDDSSRSFCRSQDLN